MRRALVLLLLASCAPLRGRGSSAIVLLAKPAAPELGAVRYLKANAVDDYRAENRRYAEEEMRAACGGRPFKVDHEWEEQGEGGGLAASTWQVVKFHCAE